MFSLKSNLFLFETYQQKQWISHGITALIALFVMALVLCPDFVHAATETGMPYEKGLAKVRDSLTGPFAMGVSIFAIVSAFAAILFGGDLNGFIKTLLTIVIGVAVLANAAVIWNLVGGNGSMISPSDVSFVISAEPIIQLYSFSSVTV